MPSVLITGGDGYLGSRIANRYLSETDDRVVIGVRATTRAQFAAKRAAVAERLRHDRRRVNVLALDLTAPTVESAILRDVRHVVHAAAVTQFNVGAELADSVNVNGTAAVLELAMRCPALEAVGLLSTVYATGLTEGFIEEELGPRPESFANHYERSKWEAEALTAARFSSLPVRVLRVATVVADDEYGAVSQYNAFHTVLKLFFYGLLSLLPADPGTPLYLVTGAAAADDAFAAMTSGAAGTLHLTHRGARAVTVAELVEIAWERFSLDDDFRRKRLLRPLYCDVETFTALVDGAEAFAGPTLRQSVAAMAPFARQLYVRKELSTTQAERALGTPRTGADPRTAARAAIDYAVSTRWGRRAVA